MSEILEVKLIYKNERLNEVFVLADFTSSVCKPYSDVRALQAGPYVKINQLKTISENIINVVDYGSATEEAAKQFKGWRKMHSF